MPKAKSHPDQFGFDFSAPAQAEAPGSLAGLEKQICAAAGVILNSDPRNRWVIAAEMSVLLHEEVSRFTLDAYASPAREDHKVQMSRFWALVQVTKRYDVLDQLLRPIGAGLLVGEEVHTARLGHLRQQARAIQDEIKNLERKAPLIRGGNQA